MRNPVRHGTFPVAPAEAALLGGGILILVLAHSLPLLRWPYADWQAVSAETRQALTFAGPWTATCIAWIVARRSATRGIAASPVAPRMGSEIVVAHASILGVVAFGSYVVALLPVMIRTLVEATAGRLGGLVALSGLFTLAAFASLGLLLGIVFSRRLAPVTAAIATLLLVLLADSLGPIAAPVFTADIVAGQQENPVTSVWRLLFMAVITLTSLYCAGLWASRRPVPLTPVVAAPLALFLIPGGVLFASPAADQDVVLYETDAPTSCERTRPVDGTAATRIEVCVHQARSPVLDRLVDQVERVVEVAPALTKTYSRVTDVNLWIPERPGEIVLQVQPQDAAWEGFVVEDVAFVLSGTRTCSELLDGADMTQQQADSYDTSAGVALWLIDGAGGGSGSALFDSPGADAVASQLSQMGPDASTRVVSRLADDLQSCSARSRQIE